MSADDAKNGENEKKWAIQRSYFIQQLAKKGIESESTTVYEPDENGQTKTVFIKLHGTLPFLYNYCNKLAINLPLKGKTKFDCV